MGTLSVVVALLGVAVSWTLAHWELLVALAFSLVLFNALSSISDQISGIGHLLVELNTSIRAIDERFENAVDDKKMNEVGAKTTDDVVEALADIQTELAGIHKELSDIEDRRENSAKNREPKQAGLKTTDDIVNALDDIRRELETLNAKDEED